jgi:hypothetical protein
VSALQNTSKRPRFGRRPPLLQAVVLIEGRASLNCYVHEMGEDGAILEFGCPIALPSHLRLQWEAIGAGAECEVLRTEGPLVEVGFTTNEGPEIARRYSAISAR